MQGKQAAVSHLSGVAPKLNFRFDDPNDSLIQLGPGLNALPEGIILFLPHGWHAADKQNTPAQINRFVLYSQTTVSKQCSHGHDHHLKWY